MGKRSCITGAYEGAHTHAGNTGHERNLGRANGTNTLECASRKHAVVVQCTPRMGRPAIRFKLLSRRYHGFRNPGLNHSRNAARRSEPRTIAFRCARCRQPGARTGSALRLPECGSSSRRVALHVCRKDRLNSFSQPVVLILGFRRLGHLDLNLPCVHPAQWQAGIATHFRLAVCPGFRAIAKRPLPLPPARRSVALPGPFA